MESLNKMLRLGVILPHTKIYGGVKRYFEIGNLCCEMGHHFTIFTADGSFSNWFPLKCEIKKHSDIEGIQLDAIFFSQEDFLPLVLKASATRKIYYSINPKVSVRAILKHPEIEFFANSSGIRSEIERKYGVSAFPAYGGINLQMFHYRQPEQKEGGEPIVVMVYGRLSKPKKGTIKVVKACEKLYKSGVNIKLLLFDSPTDTKAERAIKRFNTIVPHSFFLNHPVERNEELFHRADIFVSAETSGGWSNTSAEAMASGVPVIATSVGTIDFVLHNETGLVLKKANKFHIRKAIKLLIDDSMSFS